MDNIVVLHFKPSNLAISLILHHLNLLCLDGEFPLGGMDVDKSTASQAVAFVIRASRNGVVPLCAEVAGLLKDKNKLLDSKVSYDKL